MENEISIKIEGRGVSLGDFSVKRILPFAKKRMVGPFIFLDHMGPHVFSKGYGMNIGPHPHIGLSTLTYLLEGRILHRDNLGCEQIIEAGAVNWMTAGHGVAHSERSLEEDLANEHRLHGLQFWVALPDNQENCEPSFAHIEADQLPQLPMGTSQCVLIAGHILGKSSPVAVYSPLFLLDVHSENGADFVFDPDGAEIAVYVAQGAIRMEGEEIPNGNLVVLKPGSSLRFVGSPNARSFVFGGVPFAHEKHVWWNFVSSSKETIREAGRRWENEEFAPVIHESKFSRVPLPRA